MKSNKTTTHQSQGEMVVRLSPQKRRSLQSSILWIWLDLRESKRQEPLDRPWKRVFTSTKDCSFLETSYLTWQRKRSQTRALFHTVTPSLQGSCKTHSEVILEPQWLPVSPQQSQIMRRPWALSNMLHAQETLKTSQLWTRMQTQFWLSRWEVRLLGYRQKWQSTKAYSRVTTSVYHQIWKTWSKTRQKRSQRNWSGRVQLEAIKVYNSSHLVY